MPWQWQGARTFSDHLRSDSQCHSDDAVSLRPRRAIMSEGGYKRCVYGETVVGHEVLVTDHDVGPDSCPSFLQTRATAFSNGNPLFLESLPRNRLRGGGQGSQKDGHTSSSEWTGEGKVERRRRRVRNCWEPNWANLQVVKEGNKRN